MSDRDLNYEKLETLIDQIQSSETRIKFIIDLLSRECSRNGLKRFAEKLYNYDETLGNELFSCLEDRDEKKRDDKKIYIVYMLEKHVQPVLITAKNKNRAIEIVKDGGGDYLTSTQDDTFESSYWTVEEVRK